MEANRWCLIYFLDEILTERIGTLQKIGISEKISDKFKLTETFAIKFEETTPISRAVKFIKMFNIPHGLSLKAL